MIQASQSNELEARLGHLLQPIRDLTKNWEVDIASHLEEYLDDLERVVITFNCGETTMNFVEAALLIQGSTCVYSKKVEYLYSLVYQVLDMVAKNKKQQKTVDADGNETEANFQEDNKEEFLSLDDTKVAKGEKIREHPSQDKNCEVHPHTPMNLIAQEEGEKDIIEMSNHKGEVMGNLSDFQMNRSGLQQQGTVFLDSDLLSLLSSHLHLLASSTPFPRHVDHPQIEKSVDTFDKETEMPPPPPLQEPVDDISAGDDGFEPLEPCVQPAEQLQEEVLPRRSERERKKVQFDIPNPKPVVDHWALCEPFVEGKLTEKKLKTGQTYRVPAGAGPTVSKKRKRKLKEIKPTLTPISQFVHARVYSHQSKFPKNPSLVPSFPEFEDLFWKEYKRRQEVKKQRQKQQTAVERVDDAEEEEEVETNWPADAENGDDGDDDDGGGDLEPLQLQFDNSAIEACGGEFLNSLGSVGSGSSTYEDIVRQHVENFMAAAAKYAQISELTKRVTEWEEKINPKLLEEEQREPFDIHNYGTRVIDCLHRNQTIPFRRITTGKPTFQICRLFLSTLQLANAYNVELSCPGELEEGMDQLGIRLLSTKRHYEELADYQAPSLATNV